MVSITKMCSAEKAAVPQQGFERYKFADIYARYVRITVTGNTGGNVTSIAEFSIFTNC